MKKQWFILIPVGITAVLMIAGWVKWKTAHRNYGIRKGKEAHRC